MKKILEHFFGKLKLKDIIILESAPDFSDNTKAVFDEMVRREINKKYKFVTY